MTAEGEGPSLAEAFVIPVPPFQPQEHEKMAWAAFLGKVNLSGWDKIPRLLANARAGDESWEAALKWVPRVETKIEDEKDALEDSIGSRAEELVAQLTDQVMLAKAECSEGLCRWQEAAEAYNQVRGSGTEAELYLRRGAMYYYAGQSERADSNFDLALNLDGSLQLRINGVKAEPPPTPGAAGGGTPQHPGMIGPLRPGETRSGTAPQYDAAFDASTLSEEEQLKQAMQASLKEDHFSAPDVAAAATAAAAKEDFAYDLPGVVEELEAAAAGCASEESSLPQVALQPWSAMVPEEAASLLQLGWSETSWGETAEPNKRWSELSAEQTTAATSLGFTEASWMWLKLRGTLPKLLAHFIQRKGQPTWDESMDKRNAEGVAAAEEYESAHKRFVEVGASLLLSGLRKGYAWCVAQLCVLLDSKTEGLYTFRKTAMLSIFALSISLTHHTITEKWSTAASKMVDQGAPQMLRAALAAFAAASGPAAIADALEPKGGGGGGGLDEGAVGLLELLVLYRKSLAALPAGTIEPPTADTDRVVALCAQRLEVDAAKSKAKSGGATAHAER